MSVRSGEGSVSGEGGGIAEGRMGDGWPSCSMASDLLLVMKVVSIGGLSGIIGPLCDRNCRSCRIAGDGDRGSGDDQHLANDGIDRRGFDEPGCWSCCRSGK